MKSTCYSCILDRAKFESDMVFETEEEKMGAIEELLDFMACHKRGIPALVGTEREIIIKRRSKNRDPYQNLKAEENRLAKGLLPAASRFYAESENKLEALVRIAAAANSMEFAVKGHDFDHSTFGNMFEKLLRGKLEGDLIEAERRLESFVNLLYLMDNSGEVIFDLLVIEKLKEMGKNVVIAAKSDPILNDATVDEIKGMTGDLVIPTGPVVGISLDCTSSQAAALLFNKEWLIISKGMGNFETISEFDWRLKGRLIYIMRAKCEPIAQELGVERGSLAVKTV